MGFIIALYAIERLRFYIVQLTARRLPDASVMGEAKALFEASNRGPDLAEVIGISGDFGQTVNDDLVLPCVVHLNKRVVKDYGRSHAIGLFQPDIPFRCIPGVGIRF